MNYYGNNDWRDYHLAHFGIKGMKWGKKKKKNPYNTDNEHDASGLKNVSRYWESEAGKTKTAINKRRGTMGPANDPQTKLLSNQYKAQKDLANRARSEAARVEKENADARKRRADKEKEDKKDFNMFNFSRPYSISTPAPTVKKTTKKKNKSAKKSNAFKKARPASDIMSL